MEWYLDNFFQDSDAYRYRGDASPSYIYFAEKVARRIKIDLPGETIKFIVIFRNPVDRAYSHYWHNVNRGLLEKLMFEEALQAESERLESQKKEVNNLGRIRYAYFNAGLYVNQVKTFLNIFPAKNFLLLLHEDLNRQNFHQTMNLTQTFLQVPAMEIQYGHSNPSYKPKSLAFQEMVRKQSLIKNLMKLIIPADTRIRWKSFLLKMNAAPVAYPPMDPSTREMLKGRFTSEINELATMINRDLSAWLK